jgi:hypothetical protein
MDPTVAGDVEGDGDEMKLWLLERIDGPSWDESRGFVVRAASAVDARILAMTRAGDEGAHVWSDPETTSCVELTEDGPAAVILQDFMAG